MLNKLGFFNAGGALRSPPPLDTILPAVVVLEVDATLQESYPGSGQVWYNLTNIPASGSSRAAYDFTMGTTTNVAGDDAAFIGSAGDEKAYWSLDGNDAFRALGSVYEYPGTLSTTPGGPDFTVVAALRYQSNGAEQRIFSTQGNSAFSRGLSIATDWTNKLHIGQFGDTQSVVTSHTPILIPGIDYLCIVACKKATNTVRFWLNNRIGTAYDFAMDTSSYNAVNYTTIAARTSGGADFLAPSTRLYHVSLLDGAIGDNEAAKIFDLLNTRHGRIYG